MMNKIALLFFSILTINSCTHSNLVTPKNACYILFDAGSSGTRLYVYEQNNTQLIEHVGPKVAALADPVRRLNGKTSTDIEYVTDQVVATLDLIKTDGSFDDSRQKWTGFDWRSQCNLVSAKVYATGGMRIAEQENAGDSLVLWQSLQPKLVAKVGENVMVETRTITGFEEGLFAWLSLKDEYPSNDFGIVEMGGASSQITFPCADCDPANDAVNTINLSGKPIQIYSYSYLGLGQDEAPHSLSLPYANTIPANCAFGIGSTHDDWAEAKCADDILITANGSKTAIRDPYNYDSTGTRGTTNTLPLFQKDIPQWSLTGAFNYTKETDIESCCINQSDTCYHPATACFTPIYLNKYLQTLSIMPKEADKNDVSWTRGAVVCETENCLAPIKKAPVCRWAAKGCLIH
ncbi:MAG: nucleoside phosphatase [Paraglaciecola sp.]|uniref:nucleoside phosphatase n=1 Tax=Paraglaciecola sp. TaxID=1920173 RepID=UPI0032976273